MKIMQASLLKISRLNEVVNIKRQNKELKNWFDYVNCSDSRRYYKRIFFSVLSAEYIVLAGVVSVSFKKLLIYSNNLKHFSFYPTVI